MFSCAETIPFDAYLLCKFPSSTTTFLRQRVQDYLMVDHVSTYCHNNCHLLWMTLIWSVICSMAKMWDMMGQGLHVIAHTCTASSAEIMPGITKIIFPLATVKDLVSYHVWLGLGLTDNEDSRDWCTWPIRCAQRLTWEPPTPQGRALTGLVPSPRDSSLSHSCLPNR